jgi:hypothetical protein
MFRRNFDFVALLVVVAGSMVIQNLPRTGVRIASAHYSRTVSVNPCGFGRTFARLARLRSE